MSSFDFLFPPETSIYWRMCEEKQDAWLQDFSLEIYFYSKPAFCEIRFEMSNHSPGCQNTSCKLRVKIFQVQKRKMKLLSSKPGNCIQRQRLFLIFRGWPLTLEDILAIDDLAGAMNRKLFVGFTTLRHLTTQISLRKKISVSDAF